MSLNIWHELDHPTQPMSYLDMPSVVNGARAGSMVAHEMDGANWLEIMARAYSENGGPAMDREFFIGEALGVRAALLDLSVQAIDSPGFSFTGMEIGDVRNAKNRFSVDSQYDSNSNQSYSAVARRMQIGDLAPSNPSSFIGFTIGMRYADLSRSQEREAA